MSAGPGDPIETSWTMILAAAGGDARQRARFARHYEELLRRCLSRWTRAPREPLDDLVQEVLLQCLKSGGVLERAASSRPPSFRRYLLGVLRNVARRSEDPERQRRPVPLDAEQLPADDAYEQTFEREWGRMLVRHALSLLRDAAEDTDAQERTRVLELRIEGLPVREIARRLDKPAERVHRDYARVRREFRRHMETALVFHEPSLRHCSRAELENLLGTLRDVAS